MTAIHLAEDGVNPLSIEWPEVILVSIVFIIVWYAIAKFAVPRFELMFKERREAIEGGIERAEQAQLEAQAMLAQYQQQLGDARGEAAQIREAARAEAQQIVEDLPRAT